ncbi:MAG: HNH endonuclease [Alphaproteobacteria bacterium]|nr:HNH endonuclease [Alphaproteobacteria bacterium]
MKSNILSEVKKDGYIHTKKSLKQRTVERVKRKKVKYQKETARAGKIPDSIHGIPIVEMEFKVPPLNERKQTRNQFKRVRNAFLKHIAENCDKELKGMGLTESQMQTVKKGKSPAGYNVHHKLPIYGGGKNEFSNFILMPIPPHDDLHHKIIDPQLKGIREGEARLVKIPFPKEMVFVAPKSKEETIVKADKLESVIGGNSEKDKNSKKKKKKKNGKKSWDNVRARAVSMQKSR